MSKNLLLPTHSCFDDALDLIEAWVTDEPAEFYRLVLVHGICQAPDGLPYSHAWVERDDDCFFIGVLNGKRQVMTVDKTIFYPEFQVGKTTRYTVAEALAENVRSNHYGPWEPEFIALCLPRSRESFLLTKDQQTGLPGIFCQQCGRISYHHDDVINRYCGHCRRFLVDTDSA